MEDIDLNKIALTPFRFNDQPENHVRHTNILRLDKIHPLISGNKWFKLRYYIDAAKPKNIQHIATYGGPWSNHLLATAAYCHKAGLSCTGIVRGEAPTYESYTLSTCRQLGMQLLFIPRLEYKAGFAPESIDLNTTLLIPEGGYGIIGAAGAATILNHINPKQFTHICCAVGTGTMMAGLINAAPPGTTVTGINVLKNKGAVEAAISPLITNKQVKYDVFYDYHFGGYARHTPQLLQLMNEFYTINQIPTDFVYTGKLVFAVQELVKTGYFPTNAQILLIHSGGITGNASLPTGSLIF